MINYFDNYIGDVSRYDGRSVREIPDVTFYKPRASYWMFTRAKIITIMAFVLITRAEKFVCYNECQAVLRPCF